MPGVPWLRLLSTFLLVVCAATHTDAHAADDVWVEETIRYDENGNVIETVDAEGRVTTRTYDDRDRLIEESAPLGKTTTYAYDGNDKRIGETRQNPGGSGSQTRTITYDDANRPVATTDAEGGTRRQTYDAAGNVIEKTDARGNTTRYTYDARNQVTSQTGPEAGQQIRYTYDKNLNKVAEAWANGRVLSYVYDALDRLIRTEDEAGIVEARELYPEGMPHTVTDAGGRITRFEYDDLHHPTTKKLSGIVDRTIATTYSIHGDVESQTDPRGHATTHEYDTLGRRVRTAYPTVDGVIAAQTMTYDKVGNLTSESNARGQVTTYVVNALNQRETQTDPDTDGTAYTQRWTYDAQGNALTHTDRRGILSVTAYDRENRVIGRARDGQILDTRTLDAVGNATIVADALGRETHATYDKANRKVRERRPLEAIATWTYTPEGDLATHTDADGRTTSNTYTNRRYLASETLAGETTTYTTNGSGQRLTRQRPNGKTWVYAYDDAGRLQTISDPLDHATTYGYDAADNRTSVVDANAHETTFAYDARNRLSGKTYPDGDDYAWQYDADGNQTQVRTPLGRTIATTYDALSRALTSTYSNPRPDEPSRTTRHYDGNANVTAIDETIGSDVRTETRSYDPFDRVEQVVNPLNRRVAYRYDAVGNRTHLTDHDGTETVWSYDALNRNVAIVVPGQGATRQTHTKAGKLDTLVRPDGSETEYTYDEAGRIERIAHTKAGQPIATYRYRYDLNGNRIEQKETNGSTTNGEAVATYAYDDADRLTQVTGPARTSSYTLDAVGNRKVEHVQTGGTTISRSVLTYNVRDQLTSRVDAVAGVSVMQTYDANGNLATQTSNGITRTYTYDGRDRLIELQDGAATPLSFDYDANGLRLKKSQGSATTNYQYDQQSLLAETNAIGNTLTRYYYSANQLISTTKAGTTPVQRHYLLDALRSPIATLTQEGVIDSRTRYDAWGEVIAQQATSGAEIAPSRDTAIASLPITDEQPVGFTGYLKDSESGLYYAKARYYDPAVARFTTEDPEAGKDMEPPSLHRYLYAYANPTAYIDFTGRETFNVKYQDMWERSWQTDPARVAVLNQRIHNASIEEKKSWQRTAVAAPYVVGGVGVAASAYSFGAVPALIGAGVGGGLSAGRQYATTGEVSASGVAMDVGLGGVVGGGLIGGLRSGSQLVRAASASAGTVLAAAGAADSGKLVGEGLATGDPAKVLVGVAEMGVSLGGGYAVSTKPVRVTEGPSGHEALSGTSEGAQRHLGLLNRNKEPLSAQDIADAKDYSTQLGLPEEKMLFFSYGGRHQRSAYSDLYDTVFVGPDLLPGNGPGLAANSRISSRGLLAHEIVGHRDTTLAGRAFEAGSLDDEVQASWRAARLAPGLTNSDRYLLLRDAVERIHSAGLTVKDIDKSKYWFGLERTATDQ